MKVLIGSVSARYEPVHVEKDVSRQSHAVIRANLCLGVRAQEAILSLFPLILWFLSRRTSKVPKILCPCQTHKFPWKTTRNNKTTKEALCLRLTKEIPKIKERKVMAKTRAPIWSARIGWSQMSGRRMSGASRPSLGAQVLAIFAFNS